MSAVLLLFLLTLFFLIWALGRRVMLMRRFWVYGEKIPGLPAHPIFGNMKDLSNLDLSDIDDFITSTAAQMRNAGHKVMRFYLVGKMYIYPLDGEALMPVLESKTEHTKGDDYNFLDPWLAGGLLFEGDADRWRSHRKMLTPAFHFAKLERYLEVFNNESRILTDLLGEFAESGQTIDIYPYIKRCALDIISGAAMGKTVNAQLNTDHAYVKAVQGFNKLSMFYAFRPLLWVPAIFWLLGYQKQKDDYLYTLKTFVNDVIAERKRALETGEVEAETTKRKMNFLDLLLSMEDSKSLTSEEIRQEVDTFMFAGHDTTSSSTSWAIWTLAHHQDVQEKVYDELKEVLGESDELSYESLGKLSYLEKVLKESKRLTPPVPFVQRKLQEDMEIGGHLIPADAVINIAPMVIHRNHKVYKNPKKFDPENFSPENIASRHPYDYVPFSAGLRNCIGQRFAQVNEKVMISQILLNFKVEPAPGFGFEDTKRCAEVVMVPSKGIPVRLTRR